MKRGITRSWLSERLISRTYRALQIHLGMTVRPSDTTLIVALGYSDIDVVPAFLASNPEFFIFEVMSRLIVVVQLLL